MLTMDTVKRADRMIIMRCGPEAEAVCLASFIETEDWALEDPHGEPIEEVRKIRGEVKKRVDNLINQLLAALRTLSLYHN